MAVNGHAMPGSNRVAFITCIMGGYDKTLKEPARQSVPSDFIAFVDFPDNYRLPETSAWKVMTADAHFTPPEKAQMRNSLQNNQHTFNIAKFYKLNYPEIECLKGYDVIVWLDGSVRITNPDCAAFFLSKFEQGWQAVCYRHDFSANYVTEANNSHFDRYTSTMWNGQRQPYQDVDAQRDAYRAEGMPLDTGMWITCMVALDMRSADTAPFLRAWYDQVLEHTTQDQISFPYCVWKTGIRLYTLPDEQLTNPHAHCATDMYIKEGHGL